VKLLGISDLHVRHEANRRALDALAPHPDDWLVVAGDVAETVADVEQALRLLCARFARVLWVPGNHELWSAPRDPLCGEARYRRLVETCRRLGVLTPEDEYVEWHGEGGRHTLALLFLLYDYSFRPAEVPVDDVLRWAMEADTVAADEVLLRPDPHPSRADWCAARCELTERRLARLPDASRLVLINHYPLRADHAVLPRVPRYRPWCGTDRTTEWHTRFRADLVVYGHLHVRTTRWRDGVRFEEVSLGYPRQWDARRGIDPYLRQLLPAPAAQLVRA
jgi:3',5'-cyclic AMP phosphodiesterase CpdA